MLIDLWRYSWIILRSNGTLQGRWRMPSHKLLVHGRFCRSWVLLSWNLPTLVSTEGKVKFAWTIVGEISRQNVPHQRKPRKQVDHLSLRVLRWVPQKVRISQCLEILHRDIRLSTTGCYYWWKSILRTWWSISFDKHPRWDQSDRSQIRSASWWCYVRSDVVRPWRHPWMVNESERSWLSVRKWYSWAVQSCEWRWVNCPCSPTCHGRL